MSNANIKIAQSSATLKTAGTLMGLWFLCVCLCFSSSVTSMISFFRGLQSLPGKISESIDNAKIDGMLKSDMIASMKLYKECEDTDHVNGFEIKLSEVSEGDSGTLKTEDGVTIKKIIFENLSFEMMYTAVHADNFEAEVTMNLGQHYGKREFLLGDCARPLTDVEEEHGKVMYIKDINIKWKPAKNEPSGGLAVQEEIKDLDSEIFSIDSEVIMYEQCNSNSKIIASAAMDIGQALSSELTLERNSINNTTFRDGTLANEKVRRIEVKNVEILPGSKWTVVEIGNHGEEGETTIVLDLPQSYEGNQLLNIGSECSDSTKSYIKYINLIYIPIKLDVNERFEVEGYRI